MVRLGAVSEHRERIHVAARLRDRPAVPVRAAVGLRDASLRLEAARDGEQAGVRIVVRIRSQRAEDVRGLLTGRPGLRDFDDRAAVEPGLTLRSLRAGRACFAPWTGLTPRASWACCTLRAGRAG